MGEVPQLQTLPNFTELLESNNLVEPIVEAASKVKPSLSTEARLMKDRYGNMHEVAPMQGEDFTLEFVKEVIETVGNKFFSQEYSKENSTRLSSPHWYETDNNSWYYLGGGEERNAYLVHNKKSNRVIKIGIREFRDTRKLDDAAYFTIEDDPHLTFVAEDTLVTGIYDEKYGRSGVARRYRYSDASNYGNITLKRTDGSTFQFAMDEFIYGHKLGKNHVKDPLDFFEGDNDEAIFKVSPPNDLLVQAELGAPIIGVGRRKVKELEAKGLFIPVGAEMEIGSDGWIREEIKSNNVGVKTPVYRLQKDGSYAWELRNNNLRLFDARVDDKQQNKARLKNRKFPWE